MHRHCAWFLVIFVAGSVFAQPFTFTHLAGSAGGSLYRDADTPFAAHFSFRTSTIAMDTSGNLYTADYGTIRKITPAGVVTTLAGVFLPCTYSVCVAADGIGAAARFKAIVSMTADRNGNLYLVDGYAIRKVTPSGTVTTLAGVADTGGYVDATGTAARFLAPYGIAVDGNGNVFVTDTWGVNTIRKITPTGVVTTFAGQELTSGSADGTGTAATFDTPLGLAIDGAGNIFVADSRNYTIRKITSAGVVSTFAGTAGTSGSADGVGATATFRALDGVAVDGAGNVYVSDNYTIRKITSAQVVTTVAGVAGTPGYVDGTGAAAQLTLGALVADAAGNVYFPEPFDNTIRKMNTSYAVSTIAGVRVERGTADGTGAAARFNFPAGLDVDSSGNVYVAEYVKSTIRKITPSGVVTTFAGTAGSVGTTDGVGSAALFRIPMDIAIDANNNLFVADASGCNIRKITPSASVSTIAFTGVLAGTVCPEAIAIGGSGGLVVFSNRALYSVTQAGEATLIAGSPGVPGTADGSGADARFSDAKGIAVAGSDIYVADTANHTIRKISAGGVSTFAGLAGSAGSVDGNGSNARFRKPYAIASDPNGNLYVADEGNMTIRMITPAADVTTIGGPVTQDPGQTGVIGSADGTAAAARFAAPEGIAFRNGNLYVSDRGNTAIRLGRPTIADVATVSPTPVQHGALAVFGTTPSTATAWSWRVLRRPSGSTAQLSSTTANNPSLTPDVSDLYTIELLAETSTSARISTVDLQVAGAAKGDANGDGSLNAADVFYLINNLFNAGADPVGSGDVNGDGKVNVADIFYLINNIFAGGPGPQ